MDDRANSLCGLTMESKQSREQMKPLREKLIEDMKSIGRTTIPTSNNMVVKLVEKKTRKTIGTKAMLTIISKELGEDSAGKIRAACELARGSPQIKHTLKIVEASDDTPAPEPAV